MIKTTTKYLF